MIQAIFISGKKAEKQSSEKLGASWELPKVLPRAASARKRPEPA